MVEHHLHSLLFLQMKQLMYECVCHCVCRGFVQRCAQCDPSVSEESLRRANKALDHIVQQGVRVLSERLYLHIRVLTHTEAASPFPEPQPDSDLNPKHDPVTYTPTHL